YTDGLGNQPYANSAGCISIGNFTDQEEFGQQTNIDKAETRGLELTAGYRINQNWDISGGYTYTDSEITSGDSKGEKLTNTPKHMLTADVTWKITDRWSSTLEGEYYSSRERFTGEVSGQSASLVEQLGNKLDSYAIFNLKSSYQVTPEFRLIGSINNLLDKDFSDADTYTHNGETEVAYNYIDTGRSTSGVALDRRNLWLSAIYDF
ncbi:TonB-dependent receptor, partial [Oceanospirillum sp. HFRX-1_2]